MDHIENAKLEISKAWFPNHTAKLSGSNGLQEIIWSENDTGIFSVKYVLAGHNVFVSGDFGDAVYTLSVPATIDSIKKTDLRYFTGKLRAHSGDRWDFDQDLAVSELNEWWSEIEVDEGREDEADELYKKIKNCIHDWSSAPDYERGVYAALKDSDASFIDGESVNIISEFGRKLPKRIIGYWLGLQMALEQVKSTQRISIHS